MISLFDFNFSTTHCKTRFTRLWQPPCLSFSWLWFRYCCWTCWSLWWVTPTPWSFSRVRKNGWNSGRRSSLPWKEPSTKWTAKSIWWRTALKCRAGVTAATGHRPKKKYEVSWSLKVKFLLNCFPLERTLITLLFSSGKNKTRARQRKGALNNWKVCHIL